MSMAKNRYRVKGVCLVPSFAEMAVDADTPEEAMEKANELLNRDSTKLHFAITDHEDNSAFDFKANCVFLEPKPRTRRK